MSPRMLQRLSAGGALSLALITAGCSGIEGGSAVHSPTIILGPAPSPPPFPTPTPASSPTPAPSPVPARTAAGELATAVIVQSGDSIGAGYTADWAAIDHLGYPSSVAIHNVSKVGIAMQAGFGERERELFSFAGRTVPSVLIIQQGTNDLYYGTTATTLYVNILELFVATARDAGFYVVVNTILPRADSGWTPAMEQQRLLYNDLVRTNRAGADAINDIAADPVIGDGVNPATSPSYTDGVHPTLLGQQRLAQLDAAVLSPFLQRAARTARLDR